MVQTPRTRIIAMSTSGVLLRTSTAIQAPMKAKPTSASPMVLPDTQPHSVVWLTASRTPEMPRVISAAAVQLTLPGVRTGDSGTSRQVAIAAITIRTNGIQNSQW